MESSPQPADRKRFVRALAALLGILLTVGSFVVAVRLTEPMAGRGVTYADMDGDGDLDIFANPFKSVTRAKVVRPAETFAHWIDPARNDIDRFIINQFELRSTIRVRTDLPDLQVIFEPAETPLLELTQDQPIEVRDRLEN